MNIIGLDLSLCDSGICIFNGNEYSTLSITSKPNEKLKDINEITQITKLKFLRIINIFNDITDIIKINMPCIIIMENYSYNSKNTQSITDLAELQGLLKYFLIKYKIDFFMVAPTTLKKFITGKGNSKKDEILKTVYKRWKLDINNHNQADAYGLVKYYQEVINK
jgi:crossover junction endodeoxyribonuclease RuvC